MANRFNFRAWDKWDKRGKRMLMPHHGNFFKWHPASEFIDSLIIMQSTGLTDKNGVEIFEGDILVRDTTERYYVVVWYFSENQVGWKKHPVGNERALTDIGSDSLTLIVAGNIYENPELLKGV